MDSAWDQVSTASGSDELRDIFQGEVLTTFAGPDGKHFGLGGEEGRYVFSLGVDFFNPHGNKQAGKKKSIGLISLVCLNLPPNLRYKPENMFLAGIVPGPREPPLTCLNHYLTPLVDDLMEFWDQGIYLSRTSEYRHGRLVRCALICVVCDLPAARKTAGFAAFSHHYFCAICYCDRDTHGYGDLNVGSWRRRNNDECRAHANSYINAPNAKLRQAQFDSSGLRWSELYRLPYFDPARFVVVDAMHNLFLGLIKEHFEILGIRIDKDEKMSVFEVKLSDVGTTFTAKEKTSMNTVVRWLSTPMNQSLATIDGYNLWKERLLRCHLSVLAHICKQLGAERLPAAPANKTKWHKADWADALLSWVSCKPLNWFHI
jgi:hypothetical protein